MFGMRPKTLREVASRVKGGEQGFDTAVREFLDEFYLHPELRETAIGDAPELIDPLRRERGRPNSQMMKRPV